MRNWRASREKCLRRGEVIVKHAPSGFGLIIVASEILDGRIQDRHFENTRRLLQSRNHALTYSMILSDEPLLILDKLKWAMGRAEPFFCCGGIGSTPDDYTRQCAAQAVGLPLEFHPEGVEILKRRPGFPLTPSRMKLVEFPKGAELIPNPVNQVPGFTMRNGHFVPGFPSMAEPMTAWSMPLGLEDYLPTGRRAPGRSLFNASSETEHLREVKLPREKCAFRIRPDHCRQRDPRRQNSGPAF